MIKGADQPQGTLTTSYAMDALTTEIELTKSGFAKATLKFGPTNVVVSSLQEPLEQLKISSSYVAGDIGCKGEIIAKQMKGVVSACYVSGPGAMGLEANFSKASGLGSMAVAAQCKVGDIMWSAKTTTKLDSYQIAMVKASATDSGGFALDGGAKGDIKASLAFAKKVGGGHSVKVVVMNPVKKSFDPVVSANFVTSAVPKTTTTIAVQVDKAVRSSIVLFVVVVVVVVCEFFFECFCACSSFFFVYCAARRLRLFFFYAVCEHHIKH